MPPKKYLKVGETVFGLWPGSGGLYFKGVIVESDPEGGTYDVKFEEGTTYTLLEKHVKPVDAFKALEPKSAQRQVGSNASRSRGRPRSSSTSRSRSRSRSRTPGRKSQSIRKISPSYKKGSSLNENSSSPVKSERQVSARKKLIEDEDTKVKPSPEDITEDVPRKRTVRGKLEAREEEAVEDFAQRRSTRLAEKMKKEETEINGLQDTSKRNENDPELEVANLPSNSENTVDDDENIPKLGGFSAMLTTLAYIALVFYFYLMCQKNQCQLDSTYKFTTVDLIDFYHPLVSLCVEAFFLSVLIGSMLPYGDVISTQTGAKSRCNGTLTSALILLIFAALKYHFQASSFMIVQNVSRFLIPTFIVGFVAAILVAYKSKSERTDGGVMQHFVVGSSLHVSFSGVSVKVWIHRSIFLSVILLNSLTIEAGYELSGIFSPTLTLTAAMQILFSAEAILNERFLFTSFEFNNVKLGWMYLTILAYPFTAFLATLGIFTSKHELPPYCLVPIGVLFLVGLWIKVASNKQKETYLNDAENSISADAETLTSPNGEKLIISGWWGCLRHPNYLGDVMMHCAFALPCGTALVLPHVIAIFITMNLLYRTIENDTIGKIKYGPAWDRYCQRVPSRVIPRIF